MSHIFNFWWAIQTFQTIIFGYEFIASLFVQECFPSYSLNDKFNFFPLIVICNFVLMKLKCSRLNNEAVLDSSRRLYNYNLFFRNEFYKNDTELSKELWQIKMKNCTSKIIWRIIRKGPPYNHNSRKCYLCLNQK